MDYPATPSGSLRTIDLFVALSLAADMALGLPAGHGVRACYICMHIAEQLELPLDQRADLFYAALLMDAGCTAWASQIATTILGDEIDARRELFYFSDFGDPRKVLKWLARYMAAGEGLGTRVKRIVGFGMHGKQFMMEGLRNTADVAARLAGRLDRSPEVQAALRSAFEQWDGSGRHGQRAESIPIISRIVYATIFLEVFHQVGGRAAAVRIARARRGKALDPAVVDAFNRLADDDVFWRGLENETIWETIRQLEPDSPSRYISEARLDEITRAFADFADLKSFYAAGHSRRVAALAERMASYLALVPTKITDIRRAALLHDIGLVGVPSFVLHKPEGRLSAAEWENLRLHPYYAERILARVPVFTPLLPLVAAHHERPDGQGYYRGLVQDQILLGARIIAVADAFDDLTHAGPGRAALDTDATLDELGRGVGTRFCPNAFSALARVLDRSWSNPLAPDVAGKVAGSNGPKREWPARLTDREVEVLRALTTGDSRRAMADRLSVSEHTIRHHLEHIYDKIDVHTRVAATLFALEHDLLP